VAPDKVPDIGRESHAVEGQGNDVHARCVWFR
jgi:hypothetical protein